MKQEVDNRDVSNRKRILASTNVVGDVWISNSCRTCCTSKEILFFSREALIESQHRSVSNREFNEREG
jgi:hypothetical protein